ncbi:Mg2+ and Co2+ transporter CorA [Paraburkholderia youngii]
MKSDLALQTYGADSSGMVCGFRFSPTLAGRPIDADEVIDWFRERDDDADATAEDAGEFLWLHFNLAHSASERWMRTQLDLPEAFFDALREGSHSTRIEHADGALRAVVNDVMFNLEFIPSEIATLWIYANKRLIVTARLKPLRSVDRLRASVRQGEVFRSPAELLVHLMRDQADLRVQIVRRTSADVDRIEDRFLSQGRRKTASTSARCVAR